MEHIPSHAELALVSVTGFKQSRASWVTCQVMSEYSNKLLAMLLPEEVQEPLFEDTKQKPHEVKQLPKITTFKILGISNEGLIPNPMLTRAVKYV